MVPIAAFVAGLSAHGGVLLVPAFAAKPAKAIGIHLQLK
jgi:hypothetical protein